MATSTILFSLFLDRYGTAILYIVAGFIGFAFFVMIYDVFRSIRAWKKNL